MRRNRRSRPILESLDGRLLLSGYGTTLPTLPSASVIPVAQHQQWVALQGSIKGSLQLINSNPDPGYSYKVNAKGTVQPAGMVGASGSLQTPGIVGAGYSNGMLTLSSRHGSVRLDLLSDPHPGVSSLPTTFDYTLIGTGKFRGASGAGTATLTLDTTASTPTGHGTHVGGASVTRFTMTFAGSTTAAAAEIITATLRNLEPVRQVPATTAAAAETTTATPGVLNPLGVG
jgi:hypothetical protein